MRNASRRSGRGRGANNASHVKKILLEAAREALANHGFSDTTLKNVATVAGVDVGMIRYYFGDKQGLYEEVLRSTLHKVIAKMTRKTSLPIRRFIVTFMQTLSQNPWLPPLILRELAADRTKMHAVFMTEFIGGLLPVLLETVSRGQRSGELDPTLDPRLLAQSLLSMTLLPFALVPTAAPVLGLRLSGKDFKNLVDQTEHQFLSGARPPRSDHNQP